MTDSGPRLPALTKLFRALARTRDLAGRRRARMPWRLLLGARSGRAGAELARAWPGGYALVRDETTGQAHYLYVPRELGQSGIERLSRPYRSEPLIAALLPEGGVAVDVGAHLGDWTVPLARRAGHGGRVIAFEPIPFLAAALRKTAAVNGLGGVAVVERVLSDRPGPVSFTIVADESRGLDAGKSGIGREREGGRTVTLEAVTLDSHLAGESLVRLDFLKIDVEANEARVLAGARATLARFRPALVFEAGQESAAERAAVRALLEGIGYRMVGAVLEHGIAEADWGAYVAMAAPFEAGRYCNVLCLAG